MDTPQINVCKVEGHEEQQLIPYLCISQQCDQMSRFICQACLVDYSHSHNGQKPQLLSKEKLSAQLKSNIAELKIKYQETQQVSKQQKKETLQLVSEIQFLIQGLKEVLEIQNDQSSDSDEKYFESLNNLIKESFFQLSPDDINSILNISDYKLNTQSTEKLVQILQDITQQFESLKVNIQRHYISKSLERKYVNIDDKIRKFKFAEQYTQTYNINQGFCNYLKISPDNQYIAIVYHEVNYKTDENGDKIKINQYRFQNQEYEIYKKYYFEVVDLESKTKKKLKFNNKEIDFLQFSSDSQLLYYKESQEPFCCFQLSNDKLTDYRHFVQLQKIKDILQVQQYRTFVITYSNCILLLDMEFENKLFEIKVQNLNDIVYDNTKKILITSGMTLIEFFDGETGSKINENCLKLNLSQLQLSDDKSKLFACEKDIIYKLNIFYNDKVIAIDVLQKIQYQETVISYGQVWNQQYIVVFGNYGIMTIYDKYFMMLKEIFIGFDGSQRKEINSGQCSEDFSEITVTSIRDNRYQRLKLESN